MSCDMSKKTVYSIPKLYDGVVCNLVQVNLEGFLPARE